MRAVPCAPRTQPHRVLSAFSTSAPAAATRSAPSPVGPPSQTFPSNSPASTSTRTPPARRRNSAPKILSPQHHWITADVFTYSPDPQPDIVLSALFTHHLSSPEIVRFLRWMEDHARLGWYINDLHRSQRAAFFFRFLPILFGWHRFIAYDGPVSLRRSFVPEDWQRMLTQAKVSGANIEQHPMNRLCVARIR